MNELNLPQLAHRYIPQPKSAQCLSLASSFLSLAKPDQVEMATGFAVGAVSPLGLPQQVPLIIDTCLSQHDIVLCGAGSHQASLIVNYELLTHITQPKVADIIEKTGLSNKHFYLPIKAVLRYAFTLHNSA